MAETLTMALLEELFREIWGGERNLIWGRERNLPPVDPALRAEMDAVWEISGELARQIRAQHSGSRVSFSLEPTWVARDDETLTFAEYALRETLIERGIEICEGLGKERRLPGVRAAYVPTLRRIELEPGHVPATRFSLLAHEGAHAFTMSGIRSETLAEVVAETTTHLVTKPYIRPRNADSHLYIALYAAMAGPDVNATWERAAPYVAQATLAMREGIAACAVPIAA